jgi:DNA-binding response OmpR family regulator
MSRILVVDDDDLIRTVVTERLRRTGFEVVAAADLAEARAAVARALPDAALLDIRLPDGDGTDLLRELVADSTVACAVIMMTSVPGALAVMWRSSSRPSIPGMRMSERTTSTGSACRPAAAA